MPGPTGSDVPIADGNHRTVPRVPRLVSRSGGDRTPSRGRSERLTDDSSISSFRMPAPLGAKGMPALSVQSLEAKAVFAPSSCIYVAVNRTHPPGNARTAPAP